MSKGRDAKPHIGIFGRRNNGKSSIINALSEQELAIVSDVAGTTTDPVKKSMEIHGVGPVVLIDTAGIDDVGELGEKRVAKTMETLKVVDLAIIVITGNVFAEPERKLIDELNNYEIPFFVVHNKSDNEVLSNHIKNLIENAYSTKVVDFSCQEKLNKNELLLTINKFIPESAYQSKSLIGNLLSFGDNVLLITSADIEAPEGRMILPQIQVIRDILDNDCIITILKEKELDSFYKIMSPKPKLVITDSQVFNKVDASIPKEVPLTSFSIILAKHKGDFKNYLKGTPFLSKLKDGDKILILESCSQHVSCNDIGRTKIPLWLSNFNGRNLEFDVVVGPNKLPEDINQYSMIIQCDGCTLTRKQIINRLKPAIEAGIPISNYGMSIAYIQGVYERAISPFVKIENNSLDYL